MSSPGCFWPSVPVVSIYVGPSPPYMNLVSSSDEIHIESVCPFHVPLSLCPCRFISVSYILTDDLVSSSDEIHVVSVEELGDNVGAEGEGDAAVVLAPALDVLVGVGPEQVAEEARVRNVRRPHDSSDLLHRLRRERERTSVKSREHSRTSSKMLLFLFVFWFVCFFA